MTIDQELITLGSPVVTTRKFAVGVTKTHTITVQIIGNLAESLCTRTSAERKTISSSIVYSSRLPIGDFFLLICG